MTTEHLRKACPKLHDNVSIPSISLLVLLSPVLVILAGCHTVQITKAKAPKTEKLEAKAPKTEKLDGIPFYVKKAGCKHEVVWFEPVYTLTLEEITTPSGADAKSQTTPRGAVVLSLSQYREDPTVREFLNALSSVGSQFEDVLKKWDAITKVPYTPTDFPSDAKNRVLVSNTNTPDVYVDYGTTYYINGNRPFAGSAKIDAKLASDGTLTEASVEIESKTLETLLGPVNAAITAGLPLAAKKEGIQPEKRLKLTTEVSGYRHTFSRIESSATFPCDVLSAENVPGNIKLFNYSRESVAAASGAEKKSKNKIQVSGEITLPETPAKPKDDKGTPPE